MMKGDKWAFASFDKALSFKPDHFETNWLKFKYLVKIGEIEKAYEMLEKLNEYNPTNYFAYYYLGIWKYWE